MYCANPMDQVLLFYRHLVIYIFHKKARDHLVYIENIGNLKDFNYIRKIHTRAFAAKRWILFITSKNSMEWTNILWAASSSCRRWLICEGSLAADAFLRQAAQRCPFLVLATLPPIPQAHSATRFRLAATACPTSIRNAACLLFLCPRRCHLPLLTNTGARSFLRWWTPGVRNSCQ